MYLKINIYRLIFLLILLLSLIVSIEYFSFFYKEQKDNINAFIILISNFILCLSVFILRNEKVKYINHYLFIIYLLLISVLIHIYFLLGFFWLAIFLKLTFALFLIYIFTLDKFLTFNFNSVINFIFVTFCFSLLLGYLFSNFIFLNERWRFNGSASTSSFIAMSIGIFISYFLSKFISRSGIYRRFINLLIIIFLIFILFYVGSRQPFYGFFLALLFAIFSLNKFLLSILMFFTCLLLFYYYEYISGFIYNYELFFQLDNIADNSMLNRLRYITFSFEYMFSNSLLIFGMGLNSFPLLYPVGEAKSLHATHNLLLFIVVNFGLVGFVYFVFVYVKCIITSNFKNKILLYYMIFGCSLNNPEYFMSIILIFLLVYFYNSRSF